MQRKHRVWPDTTLSFRKDRLLQGMIVLYAGFWGWMAVEPYAWSNWWLENLLVLAACAGLGLTFRRFRFSNVSYALIVVFLALHTLGAHYSYNTTPIDRLLHQWFGFERDNFDRVVHTAFGLLIAYPVWEFSVRIVGLKRGWAYWSTPMLILAFGAMYELIEMWVALLVAPEVGTRFLGTQGDVWDAQHDMEVALYGAVAAMAVQGVLFFFKKRGPVQRT